MWVLVLHTPLWGRPPVAPTTAGGGGGPAFGGPFTLVESKMVDEKLLPILNEDHFLMYPN